MDHGRRNALISMQVRPKWLGRREVAQQNNRLIASPR
ncbi:predicted protein [Sclerotinia sclerotiorum 1980 UF-70]|uniref:Uncharacterized protein n=1 Tax=Sclerotinia sclerotiorum (strain ATCC 18683 / 1980 / Ss-1) TaxID=665079 RepID=A7EMC0_SCLS1|nr:predicted protein [Sclerotinia sclerotiorum 1980 UF-70]EDO03986.1 predicted protein [Sclerotinia sclerotiorum 1980 UF-70]